jgi:phosphoglycerate dehydrogenase-like enzyme
MDSSQLKIWCNAQLSPDATDELRAATDGHDLAFARDAASNLSAGGTDESLAAADIAFGQPDPEQIQRLPGLRWIQLTSAGYTRYDRDDLRQALLARGAILTNSSSVYDDPCAQHVLAFMMAQARRLPDALSAQFHGEGWTFDRLRPICRVLDGDEVLILGYGAIARRLIELLQPFHLNIKAVRQTVRGDELVPTYPVPDLDQLLPSADHVVDVLPSRPSTDGLLNAARIGLMKRGAAVYNVGRGTTLDQEALLAALRSGHVGAALLDVTDPEPLPADHPLWTAPNCYITPHIAGGCQQEYSRLVRHFAGNLRRFEVGGTLIDRVL